MFCASVVISRRPTIKNINLNPVLGLYRNKNISTIIITALVHYEFFVNKKFIENSTKIYKYNPTLKIERNLN